MTSLSTIKPKLSQTQTPTSLYHLEIEKKSCGSARVLNRSIGRIQKGPESGPRWLKARRGTSKLENALEWTFVKSNCSYRAIRERKWRSIEFYSSNRHKEGQSGQFWVQTWKSLIQPYEFEENVNTSINLLKLGKSDGRIKRYQQPKFVRSRLDVESEANNDFFRNQNDFRSNRMYLRVKLKKVQIFSNCPNRTSGWGDFNNWSIWQPYGRDRRLYWSKCDLFAPDSPQP